MAGKKTDYAALKQKLSEFLSGFATVDDNGRKHFKYAEQLTNLAHRYRFIKKYLNRKQYTFYTILSGLRSFKEVLGTGSYWCLPYWGSKEKYPNWCM